MRGLHYRWMGLVAFGLILVGVAGLSGCGSKPSDGSVVEDGAALSAEQKAKVRGFYADRINKANKKTAKKSSKKKS